MKNFKLDGKQLSMLEKHMTLSQNDALKEVAESYVGGAAGPDFSKIRDGKYSYDRMTSL